MSLSISTVLNMAENGSTSAATRADFGSMKRILIKMGTSVVTHLDGTVALGRVAHIVEQIVDLHVRFESSMAPIPLVVCWILPSHPLET